MCDQEKIEELYDSWLCFIIPANLTHVMNYIPNDAFSHITEFINILVKRY